MEDKRLDFDAPLLSVRRLSSMVVSSEGEDSKTMENFMPKIPIPPPYKPELNSGLVSYPSAIPFQWEQIPGRPKNEGVNHSRPFEWPLTAPKLPPGRILNAKQQPSNKELEDLNVIMSQTNNALPSKKNLSYLEDYLAKLENSKVGEKERQDSDEDNDDDSFSDALDTLSRNESFFLNCSISGVSGLEDQDTKSSSTFSADPHTRDFMMDRFLPAAKAMASETPQYASRKQPLVREQPREVKKVIGSDRRPLLYQYRRNIVPQLAQENGEEDSEEENYVDRRNLSAKACGLLPLFGLKNSFSLLNPVPGMRDRTRMPMYSVRNARMQVKTADVGPHGETDNESTWDAVYTHKLASELLPHGLPEDESKRTSESNQLTYWSDSQTPDGSSPYMRSAGGGISPYRNEASQSCFHEGMGFLGIPKEDKNFKPSGFDSYGKVSNNFGDVLSHKIGKQGLGSTIPVIEKTLYVDSTQELENPYSNFNSSATQKLMDSPDNNCKFSVENRVIEEPLSESCLQDINQFHIPKESGIVQPEMLVDIGATLPSSFDKLNLAGNKDKVAGFGKNEILDPESMSSVCSKVSMDENMDLENSQPLKVDDQGYSNVSAFHQYTLPPPLPKSPSESWLWRTLPSISSRNPYSRPYLDAQLHSKKQALGTSVGDSKWENIVKTSNVRADHLRFSKELTGHVPKQSET